FIGNPNAIRRDVSTSLRRHRMLQRGFSTVLLCLTIALTPVFAQGVQNQDTADDSKPQATKTENPPEPEAHGSRMQWKDLPGNLWHDQKAFVSSPFHINSGDAKLWVLF